MKWSFGSFAPLRGNTPLLRAAMASADGGAGAAALLLEAQSSVHLCTSLYIFVHLCTSFAALLLQARAKVDHQNSNGETALMHA